MKQVHLVCNAHLDPVWLWQWEEGAAEALSTFRTAADLCEEFDGFVFNHNEAILYQWVEEYDPALFARIRQLVHAGKWHVMGGWYLQPDCNMPSGEGLVRQIRMGRAYFRNKLGAAPRTGINLDPFGHSRGLVQVLRRAGYESYLFCRPGDKDLALPADTFRWIGYDGSEIVAHRVWRGYNSPLGKAAEKIRQWIMEHPDDEVGVVLWGIGNHGGGPSRGDVQRIAALRDETTERAISHSTPDDYFDAIAAGTAALPGFRGDLNPWAVGCYTSQIRIKQGHRQLENMLFATEKIAGAAAVAAVMQYPASEIAEATKDLLFGQFHDILPGSSVQEAEDWALGLFAHGTEILRRVRARAFFALASLESAAEEGTYPVFVYNPHPHPVEGVFECEFQLADQNWGDGVSVPTVYADGEEIPSQLEKESSNVPLDWRKRVVFAATLAPGRLNRFDCTTRLVQHVEPPRTGEEDGRLVFAGERISCEIRTKSGLIDELTVDGWPILGAGAGRLLVLEDDEDPWGMRVDRFDRQVGCFELLGSEASAEFSGVSEGHLTPVRVVEDGPVRTVVEAVYGFNTSKAVVRYLLPKHGSEISLDIRVYWFEKNRMLKLSLPTPWEHPRFIGEVAYGRHELPTDGGEAMSQRWQALISDDDERALTCVDDGVYGSSLHGGELRVSLLRSPGYSAHPIPGRTIMPQDRFLPRIDQGERRFRFWLRGGEAGERLAHVPREAQECNESPWSLSFYPAGSGTPAASAVTLQDDIVQLAAFMQSEDGRGYILRLFEPTGEERETVVSIPTLGISQSVALMGYEIKTLFLDPSAKLLAETDLLG